MANTLVLHQACVDFLSLLQRGDTAGALQLIPPRPSRGYTATLKRGLALEGEDGHYRVTGKARKALQARLRAIPPALYAPEGRHTCTGCGWTGTGDEFGVRWPRRMATVTDIDTWEAMVSEALEKATDATRDRVLASPVENADGTWKVEIPIVQNACPSCRKEAARRGRA